MKTFFTINFLLFVLLGFAQPSIPLPAGYTWVSSGSSTYLNGPFYTGNASGNNSTTCCGGVSSTTCGFNDTSLGANVQCSTVPWSVVGTPGASFIQDQEFLNLGTCNNTYADLAVPCNPGVGSTTDGANWPNTTSETRRITMTNWNNTNPESAISGLPLASRTSGTVWLPTSATLRFRDDGIGNGTGVGGDEFRLTMIGGDNNTCSSWNITATWQLDIEVPTYSVTGTKINGGISQSLSNIPNAVNAPYNATNNVHHTCCSGGCSFQSTVNSWYFPGGTNTASSGNGFAEGINILPTLVQDGSTFNVDFKGIFSISIDRFNATSGDARATMGPGMGGKVELEVIYQIWNIQAPLPVALSHFDAVKKGNETLLQWTTMSETNNEGFNLQKSSDGTSWETFDFVSGRGNSNQKVEYTGIDYKPLRGKNYYRLEQMDYDGSIHYTEIRSVNHADSKSNVQIYPNPTNQYINIIGLAQQEFEIEIYNSFGKLIETKSLNSDQEPRMDISSFHHGMYYIKINTEGKQEHFKFIKSE